MKRKGNLYEKLCKRDNLESAHKNASRHKSGRRSVIRFNEDLSTNIDKLHKSLSVGVFKPSECEYKTIKDRKKTRMLSIRPYSPDKVTQHGIINVMSPVWRDSFTRDTYTNLKDHGLHQCVERLKKDLHNDPCGTKYCLQIDLVQHYPLMNHNVIKESVRRKLKDKRLLGLIDGFVDTMQGLSLGDPLSGWIENVVMSPFDHKVKEVYHVMYYYRFQDDMVFLSGDKMALHRLRKETARDMSCIGQQIKGNWQVYPVDARGIDFIGYRFFHGYTILRKSIKQDIFRLISKYGSGEVSEDAFKKSMASRLGWLKWCDSHRLKKKIKQEITKAENKRKEKQK